jgi:ABC-type Fe3+/spermidine/putrescine transport system ATPase subunit
MLLEVRQLSQSFGNEHVLHAISFSVRAHETLSILGKSGCGKTTLLKAIAGLHEPDDGTVLVNGKDMRGVSPHQRQTVYLYQESLLFPHLNVFENIAFGLRMQKHDAAIIAQRTSEMMESLGVQDHAAKMPHQLSGGQKQRVAFGRALIINPLLLLLDEPFGNLDVDTRANMQQLFKDVARQFHITSLFVTHDVKEAIVVGDRIAYMERGSLKLFADTEEFINDPSTGVMNELQFWQQWKVSGK